MVLEYLEITFMSSAAIHQHYLRWTHSQTQRTHLTHYCGLIRLHARTHARTHARDRTHARWLRLFDTGDIPRSAAYYEWSLRAIYMQKLFMINSSSKHKKIWYVTQIYDISKHKPRLQSTQLLLSLRKK